MKEGFNYHEVIDPNKEEGDEKETHREKEHKACRELSQSICESCQAIPEALKKDPTCEISGRVYEIETPEEMLVARTQRIKGDILKRLEGAKDSQNDAEVVFLTEVLHAVEEKLSFDGVVADLHTKYGEDVEQVLEEISPGFKDGLEKASGDLERLKEEVV